MNALASLPETYNRKAHLFTPDNAREFAARGNAKKREKIARERERVAQADLILKEQAIEAARKAQEAANATPTFQSRTKTRVRLKIEALLDQMESETEPAALDRLAAAMDKLCEIERQLDGRPLPGSLRPSAPSKAKLTSVEPEFPA